MLQCQYAILGEYARQGQRGTFDILGVFDRIFVQSVPAQHGQMVLVFLLNALSEDDLGPHSFALQFQSPSGQLLTEQSASFVVKPEAGTWLGSARLIFQLQNVVLPDLGKYHFRLLVDAAEVASHPFSVVLQSPGK